MSARTLPPASAKPAPSSAAAAVASPKTTLRIAVLPGDGIGPEVMGQAVRVLQAIVPAMTDVHLTLDELPAGADEFRRRGDPLPASTLAACREADAVLMGPMGLPDVRWPDGREMSPQLDLREQLDLFCGLRPLRLFHAADSPLKHSPAGGIDLLIVRENTEGLFSSRHQPVAGGDEARDVLRVSRRGSERLFRAAFAQARRRRGKVTLVDKANVLPSMVLFRAVFDAVASEFPDVATERMYVDAAALLLVQRPQSFDVIVTENMFGDILSDLAAAVVGGMGMAPSADVGDAHAVFQPAHGSAPDIAGRGIANPTAMILTAAMMLEWLGQPPTRDAADRIRRAVAAVMSDPQSRTPDLGGQLTTRDLAGAVLAALD